MNLRKKINGFLVGVLALAVLSCARTPDETIELAYVEWACATASTNLAKAVLQERMNYDVDTVAVSAAAMWTALGAGDVDAITCAWLPVTHAEYYEETEADIDDLGANLEGASIGLTVPTYVDIDSIEELPENADRFDYEIIGIDPGAGIMGATEEAIEEYGLGDFTLVEGSGATMAAALADAVDNNEWIVVTGWTPHWKYGEWDLKELEDPKMVYGEDEDIHTITRQNLSVDSPEAYSFLDNFYMSSAELNEIMAWNEEEGADPYENAVRWIEENPNRVDQWLQ